MRLRSARGARQLGRVVATVTTLNAAIATLPARMLELPIHVWQQGISRFTTPRCRYYPTCSSYAVGALRQHGVVWGSVLATWRVLRCNPWSLGGIDHPHEAWSPASFHVKRPS